VRRRRSDATRRARSGPDCDVRAALDACERLTRRHSSTFYLGSRLFGREKRRAVSAVYAMCRTGDDAVDEADGPADARDRLAAWWAGVERAYAGRPEPEHAPEVGLAWVLERYDVPREAFEELRLGFESDLTLTRVADTDELLRYCHRVAGVVGLMIAPIAGYEGGEATLAAAVALGEAMQLTNILRDVGEDLGRDRCYLPADRMAAHGVELESLRRGAVDGAYVALIEELAALADARYRQGWTGIPKLHGVAGTAVGVASLNYEGILRKLRQNRYDNLTRRAYLRPLERIALIPRAALTVWSGAT
jgi:phytoene synthase